MTIFLLTYLLCSQYEASVEENKIDAHVITMSVTDGDEPLSAAWNAVFTIVAGDPGGLFTVKTTESNKHEGIISTAKVGNAVLTL